MPDHGRPINDYEVIVGNVGCVYRGRNGFDARVNYNRAINRSKRGVGRDAGEPVTLFRNGDIVKEYTPGEEES